MPEASISIYQPQVWQYSSTGYQSRDGHGMSVTELLVCFSFSLSDDDLFSHVLYSIYSTVWTFSPRCQQFKHFKAVYCLTLSPLSPHLFPSSFPSCRRTDPSHDPRGVTEVPSSQSPSTARLSVAHNIRPDNASDSQSRINCCAAWTCVIYSRALSQWVRPLQVCCTSYSMAVGPSKTHRPTEVH